MRIRPTLALIGLLISARGAAAACDLPTFGPTIVSTANQSDTGALLSVVVGVVGICDPTSRSFSVDLPDLQKIRTAAVQLNLGGFSRRYGMHQIGFVLQGVKAIPTDKGVSVQYGAAIDGIDRFQLAYTLYLAASR